MEDIGAGKEQLVIVGMRDYTTVAISIATSDIKFGRSEKVNEFLSEIDETTGLSNRILYNRALLEIDKMDTSRVILDSQLAKPESSFAETKMVELVYPDGQFRGQALLVVINTDKVVHKKASRVSKVFGKKDTISLSSDSDVLSLAQALVTAASILEVWENQGGMDDIVVSGEYHDLTVIEDDTLS